MATFAAMSARSVGSRPNIAGQSGDVDAQDLVVLADHRGAVVRDEAALPDLEHRVLVEGMPRARRSTAVVSAAVDSSSTDSVIVAFAVPVDGTCRGGRARCRSAVVSCGRRSR